MMNIWFYLVLSIIFHFNCNEALVRHNEKFERKMGRKGPEKPIPLEGRIAELNKLFSRLVDFHNSEANLDEHVKHTNKAGTLGASLRLDPLTFGLSKNRLKEKRLFRLTNAIDLEKLLASIGSASSYSNRIVDNAVAMNQHGK